MIRTLSTLPHSVRIVEVGPRDGLQNEKAIIPTEQKIQFIQMLADAGLPVVEATSFVSPRAIPQLSDASEVMANLSQRSSTSFPVLVPNLKGMERALASGVRAIAVFTAASDSFTRHNINATIAESLANFRPVIALARQEKITVRGYISTVFGCPYEGKVEPRRVLNVAQALLEMGIDELSLGDTIGVATPNQVVEMMSLLVHGWRYSSETARCTFPRYTWYSAGKCIDSFAVWHQYRRLISRWAWRMSVCSRSRWKFSYRRLTLYAPWHGHPHRRRP